MDKKSNSLSQNFVSRVAIATALVVAAGGCGGSGGGPPAATPPPPAPPSPVPAPSVAPFGSAGAYYSVHPAFGVGRISFETDEEGRSTVTGFDRIQSAFSEQSSFVTLHYEGDDRYSMEFYGWGGPTFTATDLDRSDPLFDIWRTKNEDGYSSVLQLAKRGSGMELSYSSFGNVVDYIVSEDSPVDGNLIFFATGSRTIAESMPRTGKASYRGVADGLWFDGETLRRLYGSTVTLAADFGEGTTTTEFALRGHEDPFGAFLNTPTTTFGTFSGIGRIHDAEFDGGFNSGGYEGRYRGSFYGPSAQEFGLSFSIDGPGDEIAWGAAAGARD